MPDHIAIPLPTTWKSVFAAIAAISGSVIAILSTLSFVQARYISPILSREATAAVTAEIKTLDPRIVSNTSRITTLEIAQVSIEGQIRAINSKVSDSARTQEQIAKKVSEIAEAVGRIEGRLQGVR